MTEVKEGRGRKTDAPGERGRGAVRAPTHGGVASAKQLGDNRLEAPPTSEHRHARPATSTPRALSRDARSVTGPAEERVHSSKTPNGPKLGSTQVPTKQQDAQTNLVHSHGGLLHGNGNAQALLEARITQKKASHEKVHTIPYPGNLIRAKTKLWL